MLKNPSESISIIKYMFEDKWSTAICPHPTGCVGACILVNYLYHNCECEGKNYYYLKVVHHNPSRIESKAQ